MDRTTGPVSAMVLAGVTLALAACGDGDGAAPSATATATTVTVTAAPSASAGAATNAPESGPTRAAESPPTALPGGPGAASRVLTQSGKTTCNVRAELVECQSTEFGKTYRAETGEPATGFVYRGSEIRWYYGNMAVTAPATTMRYGSTYTAYGWTIRADAEKTVFTRDGHGVSVDVANTTSF
ncbi:hypothetical protein [Tsukamurella paurometabola]|nr:hypothetical protein [Tsukamurella paurometabola]